MSGTKYTCATCGKPEDDCTCTATTIQRLRAERDALRARANENELCAAAVVEIRRLCKEIMGGNLSFVDDDFARCLLTLRAERDALGWARVELANIVHAERFNKSHFADDTEFADWAQSRARHQLAAIDAALAEEARTRSGE